MNYNDYTETLGDAFIVINGYEKIIKSNKYIIFSLILVIAAEVMSVAVTIAFCFAANIEIKPVPAPSSRSVLLLRSIFSRCLSKIFVLRNKPG